MTIQKVTIAGGGVLGAQIAYAAAFHGYDVTIWGRRDDSIERIKPRIDRLYQIYSQELEVAPSYIGEKNPNFPRSFFASKEEITEERIAELKEVNEKVYKSFIYTTDLEEGFGHADLVIEAIAEVVDQKKDFYEKIAPFVKEEAILVTNSSTLLPSMFREYTGREERFLSLHFANNIHRQNLAEVMKHDKTDDGVMKEVVEFARSIGMYPAVLRKEQPGYILNSILVPVLGAGLTLYGNDVADPVDIDMDWKIGTGSPKGPFEIIDLVGLTTVINILSNNPASKDPSTPIGKAMIKLKEMADKGHIGIESGQGFYKYN